MQGHLSDISNGNFKVEKKEKKICCDHSLMEKKVLKINNDIKMIQAQNQSYEAQGKMLADKNNSLQDIINDQKSMVDDLANERVKFILEVQELREKSDAFNNERAKNAEREDRLVKLNHELTKRLQETTKIIEAAEAEKVC
jgi:chromosome segregation ATPase